MSKVELVVVGASAGGLEGLSAIVKHLSPDVPVTVLIVVHTNAASPSYLPQILGRVSSMPVAFAKDGEALIPGRVIVAPPDFHLLVTPRGLSLTRGPRENGFRPAIDPLFRTAARAYPQRVMGIILSGALGDGTYGMQMIKEHGGVTVVQDPDEAPIPSMPMSVLQNVTVDHVLRADAIAAIIEQAAARQLRTEAPMSPENHKDLEPQDPGSATEVEDMEATFGPPSGLTCPDCGGALWEIPEGALVRYRCHVGHQFSPDALDTEQHSKVEAALWTAVRVLEEHADMKHRMAERARGAGLEAVSNGFLAGVEDSHQHAQMIRELLFNRRMIEPGEALKANAQSRRGRRQPEKSSKVTSTRKARSRRAS
jgi:two-component system, chemotaxis family, protein-glutamate methylesterase/glutaminase